jgi:large subunit ribosomal protein L28
MSKVCELTGKRLQIGHNVSHANNKTKRRFFPNLKKVSFKSEKLNRDIPIKICKRAIKAVDLRGGIDEFLLRAKNKNLSPRVKKIRKLLLTIVPYVKKIKKEIKSKKETKVKVN